MDSNLRFFVLANPDEANWRGLKSPFWHEYRIGTQIEIMVRRLLKACSYSDQIVISVPYDYHVDSLETLASKFRIAMHRGPRNLQEREELIARSLLPHENAFLFKVEHPLSDLETLHRLEELLTDRPREIILHGAVPGSVPFRVLSGNNTGGLREVVLSDLDRYRFGLEISDVEKIRTFKWLVEELGEEVLDLDLQQLARFLYANRFRVLFFGLPLTPCYVENCDNCAARLEAAPLSSTLPINSFIPQDITYYYKCPRCGLVHLSPRPEENEVSQLYDMEYACFLETKSSLATRSDWRWVVDNVNSRRSNLLDVGGGTGELGKFVSQGCNYGLCEISPVAAEIAREKGAWVYVGELDTLPSNTRWNYIIMMQLVEHLYFSTFSRYIKSIPNLIVPGGKLLISTPNYECRLNRIFGLASAAMPYHIHLYSADFLQDFLQRILPGTNISIMKRNFVGLPGWIAHWEKGAVLLPLRELAAERNWVLNQADDCLFVTVEF